jgi:hypothetical protein
VGAVEDEVTILVRGDYYRVALLPFGFDASPQAGKTTFIVGFVEDKTPGVDKEEVFEGGDHVLVEWPDETYPLEISPAAAPQEVEHDETAEEEDSDNEEEPDDAKK